MVMFQCPPLRGQVERSTPDEAPTCAVCQKAEATQDIAPMCGWRVCRACADTIHEGLEPPTVELRSRLRVEELHAAVLREIADLKRAVKLPGGERALTWLDIAAEALVGARTVLNAAERELAAREGR